VWNYIIRRLLQMIPILLGVSLIIYFIVHMVPGNFLTTQMLNSKMSPAQIKHLEDLYGFNDPFFVGYFKWIGGIVLRFDLGTSFVYREPVTHVIAKFLGTSVKLALPAFLLEVLIAIPLGVISAIKQYSKIDMLLTFLAFLGISFPSFFLGQLLIKTFGVDLKWLPSMGLVSAGTSYTGFAAFADQAKHLVLPVFVLTALGIGYYMRYTRMSMLEVINQDYVRTARAKGLSETKVVAKHALRNALIPIVTILGLSLPSIFGGAIITESIFGIPGIGYVSLSAINQRDYPVMMGFTLFVSCLILIGNLLSDILYSFVDPRVQLK
jgi:peptide/nickel transport system permease protein